MRVRNQKNNLKTIIHNIISVEEKKEKKSENLDIENVGGVFIVLCCGCGIAFLMALVDFLWNVEKIAINEKVTQI